MSAPHLHLHTTDTVHVRAVSSEDRVNQERDEEIVMVCNSVVRQQSFTEGQKVLLCSACQGRGEIWIRGIPYEGPSNKDQWIKTGLYGLWRDDGAMEILDV